MPWNIKKSGKIVDKLTPELENILKSEELPVVQDFASDEGFSLSEATIKKGHELFPLAVRQAIERAGFVVAETHPEMESEIRDILKTFSDTNEDKKDILSRLPKMSHLEQTLLLRELREVDK